MAENIRRIALGSYGDFSCYLISVRDGFILVDTGTPPTRRALEKGLAVAGCGTGRLKLVIMTNGLMDSTGNAAWVRRTFGAPIAVGALDAESAASRRSEDGKRIWRSPACLFASRLMKGLATKMIADLERVDPDLLIDEAFDLSAYGWDARIVGVPGYTKGSIGILASEGSFLAGNLITNTWNQFITPYVLASYAELNQSIDKILALGVTTIYPLGGPPFPMERFARALESRKLRWLRRRPGA